MSSNVTAPALPFDPIARAAETWAERIGPSDSMSAVTNVMRVQQILQASVDDRLKPHGLSFARYEALVLLSFSQRGSLPMRMMGERLQLHPTSITNIVDRLEADGLARRLPHPSDRRTTLVELTDAGRERLTAATEAVMAADFGFVGLDNADLEQLSRAADQGAPGRRRLRLTAAAATGSGGVPAEHPGRDERDHRREGQQDHDRQQRRRRSLAAHHDVLHAFDQVAHRQELATPCTIHAGADSSGMKAPDRNAIGRVIRFARPLPPSAVLATEPTSRPIARNARVPAITSGTAMYQAPLSCRPRNGSIEIADEQHQLDRARPPPTRRPGSRPRSPSTPGPAAAGAAASSPAR